ncbi:MAG: enoyl-CoA hydratase/isomerase family protein [Pseudomonadota bacterium]
MGEALIVRRGDETAELLIDRGSRRNALTQAMWEKIPSLLAPLAEDPQVKLLLIAGEGGMFSSGADVSEFAAMVADPFRRAANVEAIHGALEALARFPKPVIARIEGDCIGAACGLALACDLRYATPDARFAIPPAKLGLVYTFPQTKALIDLIGPGHAKALLLTGDAIDAAEALRIGLVNGVVASAEMAAHVARLSARMAALSQHSLRQMKRMMGMVREGVMEETAETRAMFLMSYDGPDHAEGLAAFQEKRKPLFPVR